jgi:hypothetical protein
VSWRWQNIVVTTALAPALQAINRQLTQLSIRLNARAPEAGTYTGITSITVDADGRVTQIGSTDFTPPAA